VRSRFYRRAAGLFDIVARLGDQEVAKSTAAVVKKVQIPLPADRRRRNVGPPGRETSVRDKDDSEDVRSNMADLWVVLTVIGFVLISAAYVKGCDLIIGPDSSDIDSGSEEPAPDKPVVGADR
jgi:hypothetical protein